MWVNQKKSGFTIVELLIVIVVIAILAAISFVAYNNIQLRARNSQTASALIAYKKALAAYAIDKGAYPAPYDLCLGENYPDLDNDGAGGDCSSDSGVVGYKVNATFDNALKPYLSQKPNVPSKVFTSGTRAQLGIHLRYISVYTLDGVPQPWWIVYKSEGTGPCPVGPIPTQSGNAFSSTPSPTGYTSLWTSDSVQCITPLPDPSKY